MRTCRIGFVYAIVAASFLGGTEVAGAATFNVTKTEDTADGVCDADCSLREAISAANADVAADTIMIPAGVYLMTLAGADDANATGDFDIRQDLTLIGAGTMDTVIDGNQLDRVFHVVADPFTGFIDPTTVFRDMTIQNGRTDRRGGGIRTSEIVTIERVSFLANHADKGGAVANLGPAEISYATFDGNTADAEAGALLAHGLPGLTRVSHSTFVNNVVAGPGGGISLQTDGLEIDSSTFSENNATFGGAVFVHGDEGPVSIANSTFYDNAPDGGDSAIWVQSGTSIEIRNTILNNGPEADCSTTEGVLSNGYNIESGTSCGLAASGDQQTTSALLDVLADNGGFTPTHALLPGSPAIDAGDDANCPANDQRGESRPADGDGNGSAECDIGAFEVQANGASDIVPLFGDSIGVLPDFNGNDAPEVLHLDQNGIIGTEIRDSGLGTFLGAPTFLGQIFSSRQVIGFADSGGPVVSASSVAPATGSPQSVIAVLAVNNGTNEIIVQIRDAQTGTRRANIYFLGPAFTPVRMAHVPDMNGNGAAEIAVLAIRNSDNAFLVQVRDSLSGDRLQNAYYLGPAYEPLDLVVIPDTDGDGAFEIGVLAKQRMANARFLVQVRNATGPPAPRNLFYLGPTFSPRLVLLVPDSDADGVPEIGVLALKISDGRVLMQVRDAFGSPDPRNVFVLGLDYSPVSAVAMDDADGDGAPEIAVLARRNTDSKIAVDVRNVIAPRNPRLIFFMDSTFRAEALVVVDDRDGNGIPDLGVLGKRNSDDRRRIQFKNASGLFGTRDIWLAP